MCVCGNKLSCSLSSNTNAPNAHTGYNVRENQSDENKKNKNSNCGEFTSACLFVFVFCLLKNNEKNRKKNNSIQGVGELKRKFFKTQHISLIHCAAVAFVWLIFVTVW